MDCDQAADGDADGQRDLHAQQDGHGHCHADPDGDQHALPDLYALSNLYEVPNAGAGDHPAEQYAYADPDPESDLDSVEGPDADSDQTADGHAIGNRDADACVHSDTVSDLYAVFNLYALPNLYSAAHVNADGHADVDLHAERHLDTERDLYTQQYTDDYTHFHGDRDPVPDPAFRSAL